MAGIFSDEEEKEIPRDRLCLHLKVVGMAGSLLNQKWLFEVLERHAGKLARVVLGGRGAGNSSLLPDGLIEARNSAMPIETCCNCLSQLTSALPYVKH